MKIEEGYFDIIKNAEPKYKCKIKFIQNILTKLFGYKIITEKKWCKKFDVSPDDYFRKIIESGEIGEIFLNEYNKRKDMDERERKVGSKIDLNKIKGE